MRLTEGKPLLLQLQGRWHRSRVEEVTPQLVTVRLRQGDEWTAQPGEEVAGRLFDLEGVYQFRSAAVRVYPEDDLLVMAAPAQIHRLQRRDDFRLEVSLEASYGLWGHERPADVQRAIVRDISAGGAFLAVDRPLPEGTRIWLRLSFPGGQVLKAAGEVRRSLDEPPAIGVRFMDLTERDRDRIVAYLFHRQRELRKMGLL